MKKRILSVFLVLCMFFSLIPLAVFAEKGDAAENPAATESLEQNTPETENEKETEKESEEKSKKKSEEKSEEKSEAEVTAEPTVEPTPEVTAEPTAEVTAEPTPEVTAEPTPEVTAEPTSEVTAEPTAEVTAEPTAEVTAEPTPEVTAEPTPEVTAEPTATPTVEPMQEPEKETEPFCLENAQYGACELVIGDSLTLVPANLPEGATENDVIYTSSDGAVAAVENGGATALAEGTATIIAKVTGSDGIEQTAEVVINVIALPLNVGAAPIQVNIDPGIQNGAITVYPPNVSAGDSVTVTVTPNEGYLLKSLTYTAEGAESATSIEEKNDSYTFVMPSSNVTVTAVFELAVAQIGDVKYTTLDAALVAAQAMEGDVTITLLCSFSEVLVNHATAGKDGYIFTNNLTITADSAVTVDLSGTSYKAALVAAPSGSITIGANVTLKNSGSIGNYHYHEQHTDTFTSGGVINVQGVVSPFALHADDITVNVTGKLPHYDIPDGKDGDALLKAEGNLQYNVTGKLETVPENTTDYQIKHDCISVGADYPGDLNLNLTKTAAALIQISRSNTNTTAVDFVLDTSYLYTRDPFVLDTLEMSGNSIFKGDTVTLSTSATINVGSKIVSGSFTNNGTITVDATGATEDEYLVIDYTGSQTKDLAAYGTISVGAGYEANVKDNDLYVQKRTDFNVTVDSAIQNGTVTVDKTTAIVGATVTITTTPAANYARTSLTVKCGNDIVVVTNNAFTMPAGDVTVSASFGLITHHEAVAPTCGTDGNIEFWECGGKIFSDAACTTEIALADTVVKATGKHEASSSTMHWTWIKTYDGEWTAYYSATCATCAQSIT